MATDRITLVISRAMVDPPARLARLSTTRDEALISRRGGPTSHRPPVTAQHRTEHQDMGPIQIFLLGFVGSPAIGGITGE
jgi:hypothetical protein